MQAICSGVAPVTVAVVVGWFVVGEVQHHDGVHLYLFLVCDVVFGGCGGAGCCGCVLLLLCVRFRLVTTVRLDLDKADCIVPENLV